MRLVELGEFDRLGNQTNTECESQLCLLGPQSFHLLNWSLTLLKTESCCDNNALSIVLADHESSMIVSHRAIGFNGIAARGV